MAALNFPESRATTSAASGSDIRLILDAAAEVHGKLDGAKVTWLVRGASLWVDADVAHWMREQVCEALLTLQALPISKLRLTARTADAAHILLSAQFAPPLPIRPSLNPEWSLRLQASHGRLTAKLMLPSPNALPPAGLHVLIAEDSDPVRAAMKLMLEHLGHRVSTAADGLEALECFDAEAPDLCVLDLSMPRMDGLEAARAIRAKIPAMPIVALTGHSSDEDRSRASHAGFNKLLVKPVTLASLASTIDHLHNQVAQQ